MQNYLTKFLNDVEKEVYRARKKFPVPEHTMVALTEEVGELAQALLKLKEGDRGNYNKYERLLFDVYNETVQVGCMAARIATEGDNSLDYNGIRCVYTECQRPHVGGPCPLCYE